MNNIEELFYLKEDYTIEINKPWIMMIPELAAVFKADKGSTGDAEGRKKVKAKKVFAYIYFMINFKSPIQTWEYGARHTEAMRYADVEEEDVTTAVAKKALDYYEELQFKAARALKTLAAAEKGLNALDDHLNNIDFNAKDKMGKLLHSPKEFVGNIAALNKAYDELDKFRNRVYEDLKESTTIRGQATLGDKEHKHTGRTTWAEGSATTSQPTLLSDLSAHLTELKDEGSKDNIEETEEG